MMTVAIGVAVPEGLVIAGDSRSSYPNPNNWPRIASDYTQKVCAINEQIGLTTYGWGALQSKNIHSLVEDFSDTLPKDRSITMEETVNLLADFFEEKYNAHIATGVEPPVAAGVTALGFIVGGYHNSVGQLYQCKIPGKIVVVSSFSTSNPGAIWDGQYDAICRLINGRDPRLDMSTFSPDQQSLITQSAYIIYFARMNLQDAIDFAIFLARTTIDMQRFADGIYNAPGDFQGIGGFIDVLVITREKVQWIQKKELHGEVPSWARSSY